MIENKTSIIREIIERLYDRYAFNKDKYSFECFTTKTQSRYDNSNECQGVFMRIYVDGIDLCINYRLARRIISLERNLGNYAISIHERVS